LRGAEELCPRAVWETMIRRAASSPRAIAIGKRKSLEQAAKAIGETTEAVTSVGDFTNYGTQLEKTMVRAQS
jgi:hypothetical protein